MSSNKSVELNRTFNDFMEELYNFYRTSRTPFSYLPKVAGRQINVQTFFHAVVMRGGYKKVCDDQEWSAVAKDLNLPSSCGNAAISLRRLYYKSLASFERQKFPNLSQKYINTTLNENSDSLQSMNRFPSNNLENSLGIGFSQRSETLTNNSLLFPSNLIDSVEVGRYSRNDYHYYRSILPEIQDKCVVPPWDLARPNAGSESSSLIGPLRIKDNYDLRSIELSLESGLPNEIDIALNLLVIKSASSFNGISLRRNENLLRLLLATIGFIDDDFNSFDACQSDWEKMNRLDYFRFWLSKSDCRGRKLMREHLFPYRFPENYQSRCISELSQLFHDSNQCSPYSIESSEMSRILHVATIILNIITQPPQSQSNSPITVTINGQTVVIPDADDDLAYQTAALSSPLFIHKPRPLCPLKNNNAIHLINACPPLSIWRDNARFVSSSPTAISFIILCCYSTDSYLRNLGHQLISSNISFNLIPHASDYSIELLTRLSQDFGEDIFEKKSSRNIMEHLLASETFKTDLPSLPSVSKFTLDFILSSLYKVMESNYDDCNCIFSSSLKTQQTDRNILISASNLLTNLFRVSENTNSEFLLTNLPRDIWCKMVDMLVLPDLGVVYSILEVLLAMTSSGYLGCLTLCKSTQTLYIFQTLIALLNIEGQALGQKSLHRIKLLPRNLPQAYSQFLLNNQHQTAFLRSNLNSMRILKMQTVERCSEINHKNNPSSLVSLLSCSGGGSVSNKTETNYPEKKEEPQGIDGTSNVNNINNNNNISINKTRKIHHHQNILKSNHQNFENNNNSDDEDSFDDEKYEEVDDEEDDGQDCDNNRKKKKKTTVKLLQSPIERVLANVTPHPTSLSELSDRLQMPPPSLPPPSVLKRNANKNKISLSSSSSSSPPDAKVMKTGGGDDESPQPPPPLVNGTGDYSPTNKCKLPMHQNGIKKSITMKNGINKDNNGYMPCWNSSPPTTTPTTQSNNKINGILCNGNTNNSNGNMSADDSVPDLVRTNTSVLSDSWKDPGTRVDTNEIDIDNSLLSNMEEIQVGSPQSLDDNYLEEIHKQVEIMETQSTDKTVFFCEWNECLQSFHSTDSLMKHIYENHFKQSLEACNKSRLNCLWTDCPSANIPRAKFSLLSHLNEVHCSLSKLNDRSEIIRRHPLEATKRRRIQQESQMHISGSYDSYNDQTGLSIIRNMELRRMENEINLNILGSGKPLLVNGRLVNSQPMTGNNMPPREGPVTKHLRVTAALILRNILKALPETRRFIQTEEHSLAEISFGSSPNSTKNPGAGSTMLVRTNDSNRIVAQFLYAKTTS